jgi:hypothetical protein
VAFAVLAAVLVLRWWLRRVDALGRRRPFPLISVALGAAVAVAAGVPAMRLARLDARLSEAGSALAGVPMEVRCQTLTEASVDAGADLGYVAYGPDGVPGSRAVIDRDQCGDLRDWLGAGGREPTRDQVVAVHILAHEAMHVAGETDERRTECRAVQRDAELAQLLGASREAAVALARRYYREVFPMLRDTYRDPECAPGGALDEGRPDPPW